MKKHGMKNQSKTKTKTSLVLKHLQEHGTITSWEAIENYGATRLSAIIYNLRKKHFINSRDEIFTDKYGDTSTFTKYIYCGEAV